MSEPFFRYLTPEEEYNLAHPCNSRRGGPRSKIFCERPSGHIYEDSTDMFCYGRGKTIRGFSYSWLSTEAYDKIMADKFKAFAEVDTDLAAC